MSKLNISFGTFAFEQYRGRSLQPVLDALKAEGITDIDTGEQYGSNEADLGASAPTEQGFKISTKNPGGWRPGVALKEVGPRFEAALARLKATSVDLFQIHAPDSTVAISEWMPSVQALYEQGKFRRFGISNFKPEDVRELYNHCMTNGYVLPTVYQGTYNAISRVPEARLFPVLREYDISFHSYSPIAGGFLARSRSEVEAGIEIESSRWATGPGHDPWLTGLYRGLYVKPSMLQALEKWEQIAQSQGCPKAEVAYRWLYYHSALRPVEKGDFLVAGASKIEQISQTVDGLRRGPLKPEVVKAIDEVWKLVKDDAIVDNYAWTVSQMSNK
ncbi:hypothetical protein VPNG_05596 [Cytospora leucostoma]|uniref:NADP-dependent oxidoreductase domain-containing protein n=1 Tax=Cytospora leucostoma TaxID=1230097 RepID=A0A423X7C0_9PEZI|nr:hypothetical protein VPNG_05596 [Cytospora leucostoma]